jgi:ABC-type dipeptide/oligopeptide/nickel transport system permease component
MNILRLIGKRLIILPISLLILITFTFALVEIMPGNPAVAIAGQFATPEQIERIEADLGLNDPIGVRYVNYIGAALRGDLGNSFFTGRPVAGELFRRLPATIELVGLSIIFAAIVGVALGSIGAYFRRGWYDRFSRFSITLFQSVPDFLVALLAIYFLFFLAGIAPAPVGSLGLSTAAVERTTGFLLIDTLVAGRPDAFVQYLRHLMLPVLSLGIVYSAYFGKTARSTMGSALASSQVEFARACGLSEWKTVRYAFLAARTPILTFGAILFGALVGGAAIIEIIFSWQGAGQWALEAILSLDVPVIQGFILAAGTLTILLYLALDVAVLILDPRVRYE